MDGSPAAGEVFVFSPFVSEKVGWYVYALRDPRDRRVFYVGKGVGNRVFEHAKAARGIGDAQDGDETSVGAKLDLIREIHASGHEVDAFLLRHGLRSEEHAYDVEAAIIDTLVLLDPRLDNDRFALTNLVLGHRHAALGCMHSREVTALYEAPQSPPIEVPALLIRIPGLWTPRMTDDELLEATAGWWRIGPRRAKAEYAFAVNRGVIRQVYRIESWRERRKGDRDWQHDKGKRPRWGFDGAIAPEMAHYRNTSVRHLFKRGEASPTKYVNC